MGNNESRIVEYDVVIDDKLVCKVIDRPMHDKPIGTKITNTPSYILYEDLLGKDVKKYLVKDVKTKDAYNMIKAMYEEEKIDKLIIEEVRKNLKIPSKKPSKNVVSKAKYDQVVEGFWIQTKENRRLRRKVNRLLHKNKHQ